MKAIPAILLTMRIGILSLIFQTATAQQITTAEAPAELLIRKISNECIRITLQPLSYTNHVLNNPALVGDAYPEPVIRINTLAKEMSKQVGNLSIHIKNSPLTITVTNGKGQVVQELVFENNRSLSFTFQGNEKVLGLGEGGPKPVPGTNWRLQPVQYDRRGSMDSMQPRWQGDAYGSRNPAAMLSGTSGWGLFVAAPWVLVDMRDKTKGYFIPWKPAASNAQAQTQRNQGLNNGKGLPPVDSIVPGLFDVFVFDAHDPASMMRDFSKITGPAVMPPKWALGYMQSHRTLEDDAQMTGIADSFRMKKIPIDAVIYLGTGFAPKGWNKMQPSFEFNPEVFKKDPVTVINHFHQKDVKVVLHMVPWDRDKLPSLHGNIPAKKDEIKDAGHIENYWKQHEALVKAGIDAFWPDEGDWFNLYERISRHQMYYQGSLASNPAKRPWSLQRNGYPGIAKWGGWVWSGDTESSWKTLEAQIAVGINYSLSIAPFWGSDIGGFYPNETYSGEMYVRWHQFAAFNASFRSHGRTWWLHLPWGWGRSEMGPKENRTNPPQSAMNNALVEPVIKQYNELRYQLMPYSYTLAWQARETGMPMMRSLWLHYASDEKASAIGDQFLWGSDIMVAPVYEKDAQIRKVYLPKGEWYDWWTNKPVAGGAIVEKSVDLSTMPLYVKAGAIIPMDTIRQSAADTVKAALTLKVYTGADGSFVLYEDDGESTEYLKGKYQLTKFSWDQKTKQLSIEPLKTIQNTKTDRIFVIDWIGQQKKERIRYLGKKISVSLR
ncbi:MAG: TIM-barrel domain-containing protein [Bacteroidota bacterium]